jgi:hypothetical protein
MKSHTNMNPTNKKGVVSCYRRLFLSFGEHTFFNLASVRVPNIKLHRRRKSLRA